MTVNEVITQLQKMISNGEITGNELFGRYESNDYYEYFKEAKKIGIEIQWKYREYYSDVVYIS